MSMARPKPVRAMGVIRVAADQNELLASLLASGAKSGLWPHVKTAHLQQGQSIGGAARTDGSGVRMPVVRGVG